MILKLTARHIMAKPMSSFLTLAAVSVVLTMLGGFWTIRENLERVKFAQSSVSSTEVSPGLILFVDAKSSHADVDSLRAKILQDKRFASAEVISSADAIKALEQQYGEAITKVFGNDSVSITMSLKFAEETISREQLLPLLNSLRALPGVLDVDDGSAVLPGQKGSLASRVFAWATGLLIVVFAVVALLVSHLIRLAFESSKVEIETMKVLGAARLWMFLPLLLEGLFFGVLGAIASIGILTVAVRIFLPRFAAILLPKGFEFMNLSPVSLANLFLLGVGASIVGAILTWPVINKPPREA